MVELAVAEPEPSSPMGWPDIERVNRVYGRIILRQLLLGERVSLPRRFVVSADHVAFAVKPPMRLSKLHQACVAVYAPKVVSIDPMFMALRKFVEAHKYPCMSWTERVALSFESWLASQTKLRRNT